MRVIRFTFVCCLVGAWSSVALAECETSLRLIEGVGERLDQASAISAGPMLEDVSGELHRIPYREYRVIDRSSGPAPLGGQTTFYVRDRSEQRHALMVTPRRAHGSRVSVLVKWQGPGGRELLSTKLMLENDRPMLLGTEGGENASTILCLKLKCP